MNTCSLELIYEQTWKIFSSKVCSAWMLQKILIFIGTQWLCWDTTCFSFSYAFGGFAVWDLWVPATKIVYINSNLKKQKLNMKCALA